MQSAKVEQEVKTTMESPVEKPPTGSALKRSLRDQNAEISRQLVNARLFKNVDEVRAAGLYLLLQSIEYASKQVKAQTEKAPDVDSTK